MKNIIICGSSGHAKVIIDIVEKEGKYKIIGLLDKYREIGAQTLKYKVLGREEDIPQLLTSYSIEGGIVAIGDNFVRYIVAMNITKICPGFVFFNAIHPNSEIAKDVSIGDGTVIMSGVSVNTSCSIGRFSILNTNSSLDHDSTMEDYSSLAPNVTTGGNTHIGKFSAISIGATLIHGIKIGEHTIIGAGSTVLKNVDPLKIAYGTPAKIIRDREVGSKYL